MAKACLNKLSGNVTIGCTIPQVGIKNLYLMHAEDVVVSTDSQNLAVLTATIAPGGVVILVEGYKQNIQVTSAIRTMDASTKMDFSVVFKMSRTLPGTIQRVRSLLSGKFYVVATHANGNNSFIGYTSPLECSGIDWDSNANAEMITVTLTAPEGSAGNYLMDTAGSAMDSIKSKVGV